MRIAEGGAEKETADGMTYYLHVLKKRPDGWQPPRRRSVSLKPAEPLVDFEAVSVGFRKAITADRIESLAAALGVSYEALDRLCVGWSALHQAFTFPMTSLAGKMPVICGVRLRSINGKKWAIRGSRQGLFVPEGLPARPGRFLVLEGPTDCAPAITVGLCAVGRPSCQGAVDQVIAAVGMYRPAQVVIVADGDGPGRRGAEGLASRLAHLVRDLRLIEPPEGTKDFRAWVEAGAAAADVIRRIDAAPSRRMAVSSTRKGARHG